MSPLLKTNDITISKNLKVQCNEYIFSPYHNSLCWNIEILRSLKVWGTCKDKNTLPLSQISRRFFKHWSKFVRCLSSLSATLSYTFQIFTFFFRTREPRLKANLAQSIIIIWWRGFKFILLFKGEIIKKFRKIAGIFQKSF